MDRLPNPYIDVESEFSKAVACIGGVRVDQVVRATSSPNADFLFERHNAIAELKVLQKDQIATPEFVKKASVIYARYLKTGRTQNVAFGTVRMSTEGFPEDFRREIASLYSAPIGRVIRKADRQIGATKRLLNMKNASGLLLLVNDGNTALDPSHVCWIVGEHLRDGVNSNIHHVIFFTVNMSVDVPDRRAFITGIPDDMDLNVWYSAGRRGLSSIDINLEPSIREAWFSHLSKILGRVAEVEPDESILDAMTNVSPVKR
jgi:hypothetical protein